MKRVFSVSLTCRAAGLGYGGPGGSSSASFRSLAVQGTTCVAGVIQTVGTINFTSVQVGD